MPATTWTERHVARTARELALNAAQVGATAGLLDEGATVPFIARYRKEATGSLDEVAIAAIRDRLAQLEALELRRQAITGSLQERDLLTDDLRARLDSAETMAVLEDVYLPFRPKRRTRASVARERGLAPLAELILRQQPSVNPLVEAATYVTRADTPLEEDRRVPTVEAALQGARDIIAEQINDDAEARGRVRRLFWDKGMLSSDVRSGKAESGTKYKDYFEWSEPIRTAPSHRVLAVLRGEAEEILRCEIQPPEAEAVAILDRLFVRGSSPSSEQVRLAVRDGYKRLLARSMETETRAEAKKRADAAAIQVFAQNLRQLLLRMRGRANAARAIARELALAKAETAAALAENGLVAIRQAFDERVSACHPRRGDDLLVGGAGAASGTAGRRAVWSHLSSGSPTCSAGMTSTRPPVVTLPVPVRCKRTARAAWSRSASRAGRSSLAPL